MQQGQQGDRVGDRISATPPFYRHYEGKCKVLAGKVGIGGRGPGASREEETVAKEGRGEGKVGP